MDAVYPCLMSLPTGQLYTSEELVEKTLAFTIFFVIFTQLLKNLILSVSGLMKKALRRIKVESDWLLQMMLNSEKEYGYTSVISTTQMASNICHI